MSTYDVQRWKYTQRDGSVKYGIRFGDTARIRTVVKPGHDDDAWDELEHGSPPAEPSTGAYL